MKNKTIKTTIAFVLSLCCMFSFLTISKTHEVYASYYRYVMPIHSLSVRQHHQRGKSWVPIRREQD